MRTQRTAARHLHHVWQQPSLGVLQTPATSAATAVTLRIATRALYCTGLSGKPKHEHPPWTNRQQQKTRRRRRATRHSPQSGPHDAAQLPSVVDVKKETKTTNEACAQPRAASSPTKTQGKQQSKESTQISSTTMSTFTKTASEYR